MSNRAAVMKYLEDHPNEKIYLGDLAQMVGLTDKQAQQAIYQVMRKDSEYPVEVVVAGQCWIYKPNNNGELSITFVGRTPKGSLILAIGPDDEMWIARKFDE